MERVFPRYLDALEQADRRRAISVALEVVGSGLPPERVLLELVAPAQIEVGRRWQRADWDVAREHAATAVSDAVVSALAASAAEQDPKAEPRGRVVVACVEDEWHALPARIVAEVLSLSGWSTTFLGAATPASHLGDYLVDSAPDAVALSCSLPSSLPAARRTIEAAREAGIPVIVGGRAFGPDALRAERLGANAWGASAHEAARLLEELPPTTSPAPPLTSACLGEYALLAGSRAQLVEDAMGVLGERFPGLQGYDDAQLLRTREDLGYIVDFLAAAHFVDDARIFEDFVDWLVEVLEARGVPSSAVVIAFDALAASAPDYLRTVDLLGAQSVRLRRRGLRAEHQHGGTQPGLT